MTGPISASPPQVNGAVPATPAAADARREEMRAAAQAFEAIFIRQMIGSMRQAGLASDVFGSQATEQFREMGDAQLAESMSRQGSFGIAEMLLGQMSRGAGNSGGNSNSNSGGNSGGGTTR